MGLIADLITTRKSLTPKALTDLGKRAAIYDPALPDAFAEADAVHTIAQFEENPSDGTYDLTITLRNGESITVEIAYDGDAAAVETAIDTAADGVLTGFTAGDIAVSGDALTTGALVLTFSGDSVSGTNHPLTTFDGADLTGGTVADPPVTKTTAGQSARRAWAALYTLGVITDSTPPEQTTPAAPTKGSNLIGVKPHLVAELAREAAFEDQNNDTYDLIMTALFGADHRQSPIANLAADLTPSLPGVFGV